MSDPLSSVLSSEAIEPAAELSAAATPTVLLLGLGGPVLAALEDLLGNGFDLLPVADRERAERLLHGRRIAVFCLGEQVAGEEARRLLAEVTESLPAPAPLNIVLAAGPDPLIFQDLISDDRIFYLTQSPPAAGELAALLRSAVQVFRSQLDRLQGAPAAERAAARQYELADALRRLAQQTDPAEQAELLADTAAELVRADRSYCLLYDPEDETLWGRDPATHAERRESAAVGLSSFVLRSGLPLVLARADRDPRYDREIDDPLGLGGERFLAVPLHSADGRVAAVLVAVRAAKAAEFTADDLRSLEQLATLASPHLAARLDREGGGSRLTAALAGIQGDLFRKEALDHHIRAADTQQEPLMISPAWTRWTYWTLLAMLVAALVYSLVGEVHEYAQGLAVVWMGDRTDVTANAPGTVAAVDVGAGARVQQEQVLVRFHQAQEAAERARIEQEFRLQLINRLRDPSDPGAEQALLALRAQRELAMAQLEERYLRAPVAGTVSDVRVRPGEYLAPGQVVLSIVREDEKSQPTLVVLMPGEYRPQIKRGMPMRFEIAGYRYAYQTLAVDSVGDDVVGPNEARRYLGPGISDSVSVGGPVVLVQARLPSRTFAAEGHLYRYHNGMHGVADVRVRSEKILVTLVPGLKALFGKNDV
jgi:biotin carboxyl carrier protein